MKQKELEKLYIETEHGLFTPLYTYEDIIVDANNNLEEGEDVLFQGFKIIKTAQEVYEEWLLDRSKPSKIEITPEERIKELEAKMEALNLDLQSVVQIYSNK